MNIFIGTDKLTVFILTLIFSLFVCPHRIMASPTFTDLKGNSLSVEEKRQEQKVRIFNEKGKYGAILINGKVIIKPKYDNISPFNEGYTIVKKNGKKGVFTVFGEEYLKCKYIDIVFPPKHMLINNLHPLFIVREKNNKWRLMSNEGSESKEYTTIAVSPDLDFFGEVDENKWIVISRGKKEGIMVNATKEEMTQRLLSDGYILFNHMIYSSYDGSPQLPLDEKVKEIEINGKQFLYSGKGLYTIDDESTENYFRNGDFLPSDSPNGIYVKGGKNYFINNGSIYLYQPTDNKSINIITDEMTNKKGLLCGDSCILSPLFMDIQLKKNILPDKDLYTLEIENTLFNDEDCERFIKDIDSLTARHAIVNFVTDNSSRILGLGNQPININTQKIIDVKYDKNLLWIKHTEGWDLYDSSGKNVLSKLSNYLNIDNNLFSVEKDKKFGWIYFDDNGEVKITEPVFDKIEQLDNIVGSWAGKEEKEPNIVVSKDGKKGIYSYSGELLLPCQYDNISKLYRFLQDTKIVLLLVTKDNFKGLVSTDGYEFIPCKYNNISEAYGCIMNVKDMDGRIGRFDIFKGEIIPIGKYDDFGPGGRVYKNGKMGFIDIKSNKLIIPCIYDPEALQGGMEGPDYGSSTRIALGYENANGATIDIWTLGGKKIASRKFNRNAHYLMALFIEQMLGIEVGW